MAEPTPSAPCPYSALRRALFRPLVVALLFLPGFHLRAQQSLGTVSDTTGALKVTVENLFSGLPAHGYLPLRVTIENNTGRAVSLRFDTSSRDNNYYRGQNSASGTFRLGAEAGQTAEHEILAPLVSSFVNSSGYGYGGSGSLSVRISGGGLPESQVYANSNLMAHLPCVALSTESQQRLDWSGILKQLEKAVPGSSSRGSSGGDFGARFAPERLPSHWRGLSGFDAIVFRGDEWGKVAPSARAALLDWARMGGRLVFWGDEDKTPRLADLGFEPKGAGDDELDLGLGSVIATAGKNGNDSINLISTRKLLGRPKRESSFIGAVSENYDNAPSDRADDDARDDARSPWRLLEAFGSRTFNSGQIIIILIAFAILVGPVNLFLLAKPGRRHRLFVTTPIISVAASLLIAALIFIQDGFGGNGVRASVTFLDPGARKAYTTQEQLARTGVLLGRSFTTEEPLVMTPLVLARSRWTFVNGGNDGNSLGLALADKTFSGDWFRSRSEQGHLLQMVRPTRESVQVLVAESGPSGAPVVLSTLAYPLARLVYVDAAGIVWSGENLATGEKTTLSKWDATAFRDWWSEETASLGTSLRESVRRGQRAKLPGRFYAVAAESAKVPLIETLSAIKWKNQPSLVFGLTETIGKGGPPAP